MSIGAVEAAWIAGILLAATFQSWGWVALMMLPWLMLLLGLGRSHAERRSEPRRGPHRSV